MGRVITAVCAVCEPGPAAVLAKLEGAEVDIVCKSLVPVAEPVSVAVC